MSETTDETDSRLVAGLWQVVAAHGWDGVTLRRLAAASRVPAAVIRQRFAAPQDLLRLHDRVMDDAVATATVPGQGGTPRDRVFDVLMRRIDAMQPHRAGLVRLLEELRTEPALALCLLARLPQSMARLLQAAEIDGGGLFGAVRAQGLAGVWLATLRAWVKDDSVDLGPTMAALDRALDQAERIARTVRLDAGDMAVS